MRKHVLAVVVGLSCNLATLSYAAPTGPSAGAQAEKAAVRETPSATYRAGMKTIAVPPPGELLETGSDYRVLFEHDAPDTNRLVAAFLPAEDLARLPSRSEGGLIHYALLETLRQAEFVEIDAATFKEAVAATAQQFGTSADAPPVDVKAMQEEFNHKLKAEGGSAEVSMDKPVMLGSLFSRTNAAGFGMLMNVGTGGKSEKVIAGMTLLRVQNRLLYAAVFAKYSGDDTLAWVRTTSEQWADAILKANP